MSLDKDIPVQLPVSLATQCVARVVNHEFITWVRQHHALTYSTDSLVEIPQAESGNFLDAVEDAIAAVTVQAEQDRALIQALLGFVNRVTHWEEGLPDRHDILVLLRDALTNTAPSKLPVAATFNPATLMQIAAVKPELLPELITTQPVAETLRHNIAHTCAGFHGGFISVHGRPPTLQEVWNHAILSFKDLHPATTKTGVLL